VSHHDWQATLPHNRLMIPTLEAGRVRDRTMQWTWPPQSSIRTRCRCPPGFRGRLPTRSTRFWVSEDASQHVRLASGFSRTTPTRWGTLPGLPRTPPNTFRLPSGSRRTPPNTFRCPPGSPRTTATRWGTLPGFPRTPPNPFRCASGSPRTPPNALATLAWVSRTPSQRVRKPLWVSESHLPTRWETALGFRERRPNALESVPGFPRATSQRVGTLRGWTWSWLAGPGWDSSARRGLGIRPGLK
jgi:hypothetical protein